MNRSRFSRLGLRWIGLAGLLSFNPMQANSGMTVAPAPSPTQISEINMYDAVIDAAHQYAYVGVRMGPAFAYGVAIQKINLATMQVEDSIDLSGIGTITKGAVIDPANGYAYFAGRDTPVDVPAAHALIFRIGIPPMHPFVVPSGADILQISQSHTGLTYIQSAMIDPASNIAYFGGQGCLNDTCLSGERPAAMIAVGTDPNPLSPNHFGQLGQALNVDPSFGFGFVHAAAIDTVRKVAYVAAWDPLGGSVSKIFLLDVAPGNLSVVRSLSLNSVEGKANSAGVVDAAGNAYFGITAGEEGSRIIRLDANLTRTNLLKIPGTTITKASVDNTHGFAYFYSPIGSKGLCPVNGSCFSRIYQINLANGQLWDALNLGKSDFSSQAFVVDPDNTNLALYAGVSFTGTPAVPIPDLFYKVALDGTPNQFAISLVPSSKAADPALAVDFVLTVKADLGSFAGTDLYYWNDTPLAVQSWTPGQAQVVVPRNFLATPGVASVQVVKQDGHFATAIFTITDPPPKINSFGAAPATITLGDQSILSWNVSFAASVSLDNGVGDVTALTTLPVAPTVTTTYKLTATSSIGTVSQTATVTVVQPVTATFDANPLIITVGDATALTWNTSGATDVSIAPLIGHVGPSGTLSQSPSADTTYILTAANDAGMVLTRQVTVRVVPPPTATLVANPPTIALGSSSDLTWTSSDAVSATLDDGSGPAPVAAAGTKTVNPMADTLYTLTVTNLAAKSVSVQATVAVLHVDLGITKSDSVNNLPALGRNFDYTVTVQNFGNINSGNVVITDNIQNAGVQLVSLGGCSGPAIGAPSPFSFTCGIGSLNGGAPAATRTITVRAAAIGSVTNQATILLDPAEPNPALHAHTALITSVIAERADLGITKTDSVSGSAILNTPFTYTVLVHNYGPSDATNAVVTDALPAGLTITSLPGSCTVAGSPVTLTCTLGTIPHDTDAAPLVIGVVPTLAGTLINTAQVVSGATEPVPDSVHPNISTPDSVLVRHVDLKITKSDSVANQADLGRNFDYVLTVQNRGDMASGNVVITDDIQNAGVQLVSLGGCSGPAIGALSPFSFTCGIGSLNGGAPAATRTITVRAAAIGSVTNQASIPADPAEVAPVVNHQDSIITQITIHADLKITKSASVATLYTGRTFRYTLLVSNLGPSPMAGAHVTDNLPAQVSWLGSSIDPADGFCPSNSNSFDCKISRTLNAGDPPVAIAITVMADQPGARVSNTAIVEAPAGVLDIDLSNNTSETVDVNILEAPYLVKIVVEPDGKIIGLKDLLPLQARGFDQYGNDFPVNPSWSVDNPAGALAASGAQSTFRVAAAIPGYQTFTVIASSDNSHSQRIEGSAHVTVINAPSATGDICGAHGYPVPWTPRLGVDHITFTRLAPATTVRIFSADERLVREFQSTFGEDIRWDMKNSGGSSAASGVYFFITDQAHGACPTKQGKLVIIR